jgi:lysophospholipase L1-like esterase
MNRRSARGFVVLLGLAVVARAGIAAAQVPSEPCRIMPVGDSITEGSRDFPVYRPLLLEMLEQAGHRVAYVGSRKTNGGLLHEGYGGKNAEFLAKTVPAHFAEHPADVVLLHAGHNHFAHEHPVPGIVAATEAMITEFRRVNPRVAVLVARVIPSGKLPKYSYIPELNAELAALAERLDRPGQRVIAVDQARGFDVETDTSGDKVHPNAAGAKKMAARWFEALEPLLESNTTR